MRYLENLLNLPFYLFIPIQVYESPESSPKHQADVEGIDDSNNVKKCNKFFQDVCNQNRNIPSSKSVNFKEDSDLILYNEEEEILESVDDCDSVESLQNYLDKLETTSNPQDVSSASLCRDPIKLVNSLDLDEYR